MELKRLMILVFIGWIALVATIYSSNDGYISQATETKYLRNLSGYRLVQFKDYVTVSPVANTDSLNFFSDVMWHQIAPFNKWYISGVGNVKPWSVLSKKLDSIEAKKVKYKNKYE